MFSSLVRCTAIALAALILVGGLAIAAAPAYAESQTATVSQVVTCSGGGNHEVTLGVVTAPPSVEFSAAEQNTNAELDLEAGMHGGCSKDGWAVTLVASNMVAAGIGSISADHVRAVSLSDVIRVSGQNKLPVKGTVNDTPLDTPVEVMRAAPKEGNGVYRQDIELKLIIPGYTMPGTYTTTLTATILFGPL